MARIDAVQIARRVGDVDVARLRGRGRGEGERGAEHERAGRSGAGPSMISSVSSPVPRGYRSPATDRSSRPSRGNPRRRGRDPVGPRRRITLLQAHRRRHRDSAPAAPPGRRGLVTPATGPPSVAMLQSSAHAPLNWSRRGPSQGPRPLPGVRADDQSGARVRSIERDRHRDPTRSSEPQSSITLARADGDARAAVRGHTPVLRRHGITVSIGPWRSRSTRASRSASVRPARSAWVVAVGIGRSSTCPVASASGCAPSTARWSSRPGGRGATCSRASGRSGARRGA
jgi:hypothetical protein